MPVVAENYVASFLPCSSTRSSFCLGWSGRPVGLVSVSVSVSLFDPFSKSSIFADTQITRCLRMNGLGVFPIT